MRKSTFKRLLFLFICFIYFSTNAQINNKLTVDSKAPRFTYYVDVKSVSTKTICLNVENNISKKEGVISFKTVGFPSKYFVLKANSPIKKTDLATWLQENGVELSYFGEGLVALEEIIYRKNKK